MSEKISIALLLIHSPTLVVCAFLLARKLVSIEFFGINLNISKYWNERDFVASIYHFQCM